MCAYYPVVYCVVDKKNSSNQSRIYGNPLYKTTMRKVISDAMSVLPCKDVDVFLDRNSFITNAEFKDIVSEEAKIKGINPLRVKMISSDQNKCIQLADFIAGASRSKYEYGDETIELIKEKVSFARRL